MCLKGPRKIKKKKSLGLQRKQKFKDYIPDVYKTDLDRNNKVKLYNFNEVLIEENEKLHKKILKVEVMSNINLLLEEMSNTNLLFDARLQNLEEDMTIVYKILAKLENIEGQIESIHQDVKLVKTLTNPVGSAEIDRKRRRRNDRSLMSHLGKSTE